MKHRCIDKLTLLLAWLLVGGGIAQAQEQVESTQAPQTWVDKSHSYAFNRSQDLAQWMDDFFGVPVQDAERAESFARIILMDDWTGREGHRIKARIRGQIQLPKVSERLDLLFSGEETEQGLTEEQRSQDDSLSLRFNVSETSKTRVDLTASIRSGPALLPGVRFRHQNAITDNSSYRFTQRLQYHTDDGYRSTTNLDLNRYMSEKSSVRWGNRLRYREENQFWEWSTSLAYRIWLGDHNHHPSAMEYFVSASGIDEPEVFTRNYRLGVLYRKRFYRDFLYYELEPSYNFRRDEFDEKRKGVWGFVVRLEVMLERDFRPTASSGKSPKNASS